MGSQSDVDLGKLVSEPIRAIFGFLGSQMGLGAIECLEQGHDVAVVGGLGGGKAGLVDAVVDEVVDPLVCLVNLASEVVRVRVPLSELGLDQVIKLANLVSVAPVLSRRLNVYIYIVIVRVHTSAPSIRRISLLSLLTIVLVFLSYKTGTVKRPS